MFKAILIFVLLSFEIIEGDAECNGGCPQTKFNFPGGVQITDYIRIKAAIPTMEATTVCSWLTPQQSDKKLKGTFVNYATSRYDNTYNIYFHEGRELHFLVNGPSKVIPLSIKVRTHFCMTMDTQTGIARLYTNGEIRHTFQFSNRNAIQGGGIFLLGQDQDILMGRFDPHQSLSGIVENFTLWKRALTANEVATLYSDDCSCPGNHALYLETSKIHLEGRVSAVPTQQCSQD